MKLYAGFDLHSSNSYLAIIDEKGKRVYKKKLRNDPELILGELKPYRKRIEGIAVESTFNWYWLVDLLMESGYKAHLANPAAIQKYTGLKHSDDQHDAFWLAEMLRLGILPEGYIYPKEERPIRDLLRKRGQLVKLRTSLVISLQNTISRNCGVSVSFNDVKVLKEDRISPLLMGDPGFSLFSFTYRPLIIQKNKNRANKRKHPFPPPTRLIFNRRWTAIPPDSAPVALI